jgi:apolipoprotein N-acyltransferase
MAGHRGRKVVCALLAGGGIALAMPGFPFGLLVFVILIPFLALLAEGNGFLTGITVGIAFFLVDLRWLFTLYRFNPLIIPGVLLFIVYLSLYFALFGGLIRWSRRRWGHVWGLLLLSPIVFTLLEILRSHGPLGMGFSSLYQSLYKYPLLIQIVSVAGPWALTAAIVFTNTAFYLALQKKKALYLAMGLGMIGFLLLFSLVPIPPAKNTLTVAIVSSDVPQEVKLDGRNLLPLLEDYIALGKEAAASTPDLIIFPESILPGYILRDDRLLPEFTHLAQEAHASVLFGTGDIRSGKIYNSVVLLSSSGKIIDIYDMVRPVPFGETVPCRDLLERIGLKRFIASFLPQELSRGEEFFPIGGIIGTPICFESTFPGPTRAFAKGGATLLVTVTNDAWFIKSSEMDAHFANVVFRAVETRRYVIQAANGGISGVVDPLGTIIAETIGEGILRTDVSHVEGLSIYTQLGDLPLYLFFAIVGFATVMWQEIRRRRN